MAKKPRNPIITYGLILTNRIKRAEDNLITAYFRVGEWLRDDFPNSGVTLAEFAKAADISRQSLYKYKQLAELYGTLENVPVDTTMGAAIKLRVAYIEGMEAPLLRKPGERPRGAEAMIERGGRGESFWRSSQKALRETYMLTPSEYAAIEEIVMMNRVVMTDMLREAKTKIRPQSIAA